MRNSRKWLLLSAALRSVQYGTRRLVLVLVVFLSVHLGATTYYVAKTGNDTNPGTPGLPLLTIQAGVNKAYAGDLVMVLAGTYKEQVTFQRSGTVGLPIVLRGDTTSSGEPLATIDNTTGVGATWTPAPEKGDGVYKKLGIAPKVMTWNGDEILSIHPLRMAGDTTYLGYTGFDLLDLDSNATWSPTSAYNLTTPFWQDVRVMYGTLNGETTYIRFAERSTNPDTCDLRANESGIAAILLDAVNYVTIEHLAIQGAVTGIIIDGSSHNVVQRCVIKNGVSRMGIGVGSDSNRITHNDFSLGYGSYGQFGEWGEVGLYARRWSMYELSKFVQGYDGSHDLGVVLGRCTGNQVDSNYFHRGNIGIYMWKNYHTSIFGNTFENFSSIGIYSGFETESLKVYDNDINHCNLAIRIGDLGSSNDTLRNGYFYNNRACADSGQGAFIRFHAGGDDTTAASFWFYHNSFAGGQEFAVVSPLCKHMKFVNNICSSKWLSCNGSPWFDTLATNTSGYDYNFLGGGFVEYYRWAFVDRHNLVPEDTIGGDIEHQVWPLKVWGDSVPDFTVPDTSTAYQSGLDLSDSFTLRGVKHGPLPGMRPGYFSGVKPNLGAVQDTSRAGTPQDDSRHGSVTRPLELTFAPNPVTGRDVTLRCAIPTGRVGRLALRDVLGRTVKSIALVRSGITKLDLRGFAPGIYVAALDAGGSPVSRKLIITAH